MEYPTVLIENTIKGDEKAFSELYHQLSGKMYSICLRYARDNEEANDWFQDGFIKLYKNLPGYRFEGSFEGWARRIFVTTCLDAIKKKRPQFYEVSEELNLPSTDLSINDKLDYDELIKLIQSLPDAHRTMINLYLVEDFTHKEIGELLNITESNSKSRLHKARAILKTKLEEQKLGEQRGHIKTISKL